MTASERMEVAIDLLHKGGLGAVPEALHDAVLAEEVKRLSCMETGLEYYGIHYGYLWVKGSGIGYGWQRFCPDGKARVSKSTGRDWSWQPKIWNILGKHYILLIIKARQLGFTYGCALVAQWAGQWAGLVSSQQIAIVTNKMSNSKRLVRRARDMYRRQPEWLNALSPMVNDGIMRMEYRNGSSIEPFAGNEDASAGEAATLVLVDEVGKIDNLDEVFAGLEACADSGGRIIMWGTANERQSGIGSTLHAWAVDCTSGSEKIAFTTQGPEGEMHNLPIYESDAGMGFMFLPWWLHADRDIRWYERKKRLYKGNMAKFGAEYPNDWESAFIGAGMSYFDIPSLVKQAERERQIDEEHGIEKWEVRDRRGTFLWVNKDQHHVKFMEDPYGEVVLHFADKEYSEIMGARQPFVISADCRGMGREGDFNAASAVRVGRVPMHEHDVVKEEDLLPWEQFATIHGHMDSDQYAEQLVRMGWYFGGAMISIEMNGVGVATAEAVRRIGYPHIYTRRVKPDHKNMKRTKMMGFYSTALTKGVGYAETERLLRNGWLILRDVATIGELMLIKHLKAGGIGAPSHKFDDRADAIVIACATGADATHVDTRVYIDNAFVDNDSIDDILRQIDQQARSQRFLGAKQQRYALRG